MAKKFVRGITDIKTINNQDFDTNNVNDLLSDGEHNYIHRKKKDKSEEYHNLTDNIKTISSDNTDLLSVTNYNKTTNSATLHPKHDAQKEQVLESTRNTITIAHGANGTSETTKVDTNPEKVLEHSNLLTDYGISKNTSGNTTKLGLEYTAVPDGFDLDSLTNGFVRGNNLVNSPTPNTWFFVQAFTQSNDTIQHAVNLVDENNTSYVRRRDSGVWRPWREQVGDKSVIDAMLAQKQNKLTAMGGISITGDSIMLTTLDGYNGDLNNLTDTCTVKPIDNTPNLPTGVGGNGLLYVTRVGYVVSQKYHTLDNNIYYRISNNSADNNIWTPWKKVTSTEI